MTSAFEPRNRFRGTHPVKRQLVGDARWEYWTGGHGTNGLLVLGPQLAFGDTSHRLVTVFESTRKVLTPSYPHGLNAEAVVDGLVRLLDHEGLDCVDVFGNGLGAGLAHLFIRRHPDRVDRLALAGFGLTTPFRAAAGRALIELFERLPYGSVRQHFAGIFQRHAEAGHDRYRAAELLALATELLDRHTHDSALHHLALMADLFKSGEEHVLGRPIAARALLFFANDEPCFTRQEQDNLERSYPGATVIRHLNAGRLLGLQPAPDLEKKLEVFFRPAVSQVRRVGSLRTWA